jgi:hypothetical protein
LTDEDKPAEFVVDFGRGNLPLSEIVDPIFILKFDRGNGREFIENERRSKSLGERSRNPEPLK